MSTVVVMVYFVTNCTVQHHKKHCGRTSCQRAALEVLKMKGAGQTLSNADSAAGLLLEALKISGVSFAATN